MKKITREWLNAANDDLKVIAKIIDVGDLSHIVAFHTQQSIEKSFKAIIDEFELGFVKSHKLLNLFGIAEKKLNISIDEDILNELDSLYIDSRYPSNLGLLPEGKPSHDDAVRFFDYAKKIVCQIEKILSS